MRVNSDLVHSTGCGIAEQQPRFLSKDQYVLSSECPKYMKIACRWHPKRCVCVCVCACVLAWACARASSCARARVHACVCDVTSFLPHSEQLFRR